MNLKRIRNRVLAGLMAALVAAPGVSGLTAMTAQADVTTASADAIIENVVVSNSGCNRTFTYTFVQEGEKEDSNGVANTTTVSLSNDGKVSFGVWSAGTRTWGFKDDWAMSNTYSQIQEPGIYTFLISQTQDGGDGWTDDQSEYRLRLYVEDIGTEIVKTLTLEQTKDRNGKTLTSPTKVDKATFINVYGNAGMLKVTKVVEDPSGKEPEDATYRFLFRKGTGMDDVTPQYNIRDSKGNWVSSNQTLWQTCYYDGNKVSDSGKADNLYYYVDLKNGQTIEFTNLTQGMKMGRIREVTSKDYSTSHVLTEDGEVKETKTGCDKRNIDVTLDTVLTVTNTYKGEQQVIVTGIVLSIAPYVTLVVLAGVAVALYIIIKQRMR